MTSSEFSWPLTRAQPLERGSWAGRLTLAGALLLLLATLAFMLLPVASIGLLVERNYSEGWNAYHAARLAAGEPLYGALWHPVNYPFLSFALIGWLTPWFGDPLIVGRAINLLALAAMIVLSAQIVRRLGGRSVEMVVAAACALGFQEIQAGAWLAADEPQMLAEALMLGGLLVYLSGPPGVRRLIATALLVACGGFVKHIAIAVPLAISIDLAVRHRRWLALWCLGLVVAAGLLLLLGTAVAGGGFLGDLLAPRPYRFHLIAYHATKFLLHLKMPLLGSAMLLAMPLRRPWGVLLRALAGAALAGGVLFSGGDGVSTNVYLELCVAMGILAGVAVGRMRETGPGGSGSCRPLLRWAWVAAALMLTLPLISRAGSDLAGLRSWPAAWRSQLAEQASFRAAVETLRATPGPAMCESLSLCFEAGKPLIVDPYNARAQILGGRAREAALVALLDEHRFAVVVLPQPLRRNGLPTNALAPDVLTRGRFTPATLAAIDRNYRLASTLARGAFYVPDR